MIVNIKKTKLTKSIVRQIQMGNALALINPTYECLGWVAIDGEKKIIFSRESNGELLYMPLDHELSIGQDGSLCLFKNGHFSILISEHGTQSDFEKILSMIKLAKRLGQIFI